MDKNPSGFQVDEQGPKYYQDCVEPIMAPFVRALVKTAIQPGDSVLDVACGTGFATRAAAEATGSVGSVIGSDINPNMVTFAASLPHSANTSWRQASALELPFDDDAFDVVICQQGVQFFPDVAAGLQEMARVSKRGIAATAWVELERSPYFCNMFGMLTQFCGTPVEQYARGQNDRETVLGWFKSAGLNVELEGIEEVVVLPPLAEYIPEHLKTIPFRGNFFEQSQDDQGKLCEYVEGQLTAYRTERGIAVPFTSWLAKA